MGRWIRIGEHKHIFPIEAEIKEGSIWECDCKTRFIWEDGKWLVDFSTYTLDEIAGIKW